MKKRLPPECIDCIIKNRLSDYPENETVDKVIDYKRGALKILLEGDESGSAPVIGRDISLLKEKLFGVKNDYSAIKKQFNNAMLEIENEIYSSVVSEKDPFSRALKYAAAGNYIDVSAVKDLNKMTLLNLLYSSADFSVSVCETENLRSDVLSARKIAYITDNCGEIVLDKIFIKIIKRLNSSADITAIVRGKPVANDVTFIDASAVGLTDVCKVIGNGSNVPGTFLKEINEDAKTVLNNADVIIAKGQGNFESLSLCGLNVYYLFLCKCDYFMKRFSVPRFTPVLINEKRL